MGCHAHVAAFRVICRRRFVLAVGRAQACRTGVVRIGTIAMSMSIVFEFLLWWGRGGGRGCVGFCIKQFVDQLSQQLNLFFVTYCLSGHLLDGFVGLSSGCVDLVHKLLHLCCHVGIIEPRIAYSIAHVVLVFIPGNGEAALEFFVGFLCCREAIKFANVDVENSCFFEQAFHITQNLGFVQQSRMRFQMVSMGSSKLMGLRNNSHCVLNRNC